MQKEEITVGMEVLVKGFRNISFPIIEIKDGVAKIRGNFTEKSDFPVQTIEIPLKKLIGSNAENARFSLKDSPKWDEDILVSDTGRSWFIKRFMETK